MGHASSLRVTSHVGDETLMLRWVYMSAGIRVDELIIALRSGRVLGAITLVGERTFDPSQSLASKLARPQQVRMASLGG
jgi:hypothetical protein